MRLEYVPDWIDGLALHVRMSQRLFGRTCAYWFAVSWDMVETPHGRHFMARELCVGRRTIRTIIARTARRHARAQHRSRRHAAP